MIMQCSRTLHRVWYESYRRILIVSPTEDKEVKHKILEFVPTEFCSVYDFDWTEINLTVYNMQRYYEVKFGKERF